MQTENTLSMKLVFPHLLHRFGFKSLKDLTDRHGLSYQVWAKIAADGKSPKLDELEALCGALRIKVSDVVMLAEAQARLNVPRETAVVM
jgi:DNA-binding Xre family transcriptional regulator